VKLIKSFFGAIIAGAVLSVSVFIVLTGLLLINPAIHALVIDFVTWFPPPISIGAGAVLGIISLLALSLLGKDPRSTATFRFEGKKGPVEISLGAIEDYIAKHFADKPIAHSVRTRVGVSRDRKKIRVRASISVWAEQGLKESGEKAQEEITRCLSEGLGLDNVESVSVSVDKIVASKPSKSALFGGKPSVRASVKESSDETVVKFTRGRDDDTGPAANAPIEPSEPSKDTSLDSGEEQ
jgi:uncharacterized alkaline shock family protein YloU